MKKYLMLLALVASSSLFSQKCAFVSQDSILASIPEYKLNTNKIDNLKKEYQDEIKLAKDKVNENLNQLLSTYSVKQSEDIETIKKRMNSNDLSKLELIIEEDKFIEKKVKNFDLLLTSEYNNLVKPILNKVNKVISSYAQKNKLDIVYILERVSPALAYYDQAKDITNVVIAEIKKQ